MMPGELWVAQADQVVLVTPQIEGFTKNWTVQFRRTSNPFVLVDEIDDEDGRKCAWLVLTDNGLMYTWGRHELTAYACRVSPSRSVSLNSAP